MASALRQTRKPPADSGLLLMTRQDFHRLLRALRVPAVLALTAFALLGATRLGFAPGLAGALRIAGKIAAVLAVSWVVWALGALFLNKRLSRLQLNVPDNLRARKSATRLNVLRRMWTVLMLALGLAAALTVIPWARQIGVSIFASAGIAGIVIGIAAQPVLSNLIAGLQIAFTQPVRIDDAVVVEGEWGWIEEIGLFHVVIRIWDLRRLVVPLKYFTEKPFQNWTRESASIIGSVFWRLDYRAPVAAMREKLEEYCQASPLWDGEVQVLQVTDTGTDTIEVRALAGARTSPDAWDLRCEIREKMIAWLQAEHPEALPLKRAELTPESQKNRHAESALSRRHAPPHDDSLRAGP